MIPATFQAAIMGLVEGLTEYIPVSSTGHLILADSVLGLETALDGKEMAVTFEVVIQTGAILAVLVAYPGRFLDLLKPTANGRFAGPRGVGLLVLTTLPAAAIGLPLNGYIEEHLFSNFTVAIGLAIGAVWILLAERFPRQVRKEGLDCLGWREALWIGCFQCLAMWPGMSRSAATILGGMMSGVDRKTATEYSFFAAVPVLLGASALRLVKSWPHLEPSHIPLFAVGLLVAFVSAWVAVRWLIRFVSRHSLVPFAWYRLVLAAVVLGFWYWASR
jgi:undecaprenyl-diphosphatase